MYIDLIVLTVFIVFVLIYSKRFQTYAFGFGSQIQQEENTINSSLLLILHYCLHCRGQRSMILISGL